MANIKNVLTGAANMLNSALSIDIMTSMSAVTRGLLIDLTTIRIDDMCDFNKRNYAYMQAHMLRSLHEKEVTLNTLGYNAYVDGNSDNFGTFPQKPTYTNGNNYLDFMARSRFGQLTTRTSEANRTLTNKSTLFNNSNRYFDAPNGMVFSEELPPTGGSSVENTGITYSGLPLDRNSILYKTQLLYRHNKIQSIVSSFHTNPEVVYEGQVGSVYGESRGRNLLTKSAENGFGTYSVNGYDNPYCRVWTHHYMYDRLSKTMRANSGGINYWGDDFEWNANDEGHVKANNINESGEYYDYAWRGKHNQERRLRNTVLDMETGLLTITPKYRGGESRNVHTKACMFSIENLAWKDYDPYSFEQALSWEQRGPFGGRIMWFPPYNIKITETTTAKWNQNEFIGRGENVYTYVNSERSGNLTFTMITDHPSSIDYASWWDGNGMLDNVDDGRGVSESDYLRYFAGCMGENPEGLIGNGDMDNLIKKPTPMTDEYHQIQTIVGEEQPVIYRDAILPPDPIYNTYPENNPETVEFFVFFPNNYSGVLDMPANKTSIHNNSLEKVDAIAYLLAGRNAQKKDGVTDKGISVNDVIDESVAIGYEMGETGLTTGDCISLGEFIQGGKNIQSGTWVKENGKRWQYRVDHVQPFRNGDYQGKNTLNQTVFHANMKDVASGYKYNLVLSDNLKRLSQNNGDNLYSFAEVAAAMYSEGVMDKRNMYNYLYNKMSDDGKGRVEKLIGVFKNMKLESIECCGVSNQHGKTDRNIPLSKNRMETVVAWLHTNNSWADVENTLDDNETYKSDVSLPQGEVSNVNGATAKLYRSARCVLKFKRENVTTAQNTPDSNLTKNDNFEMIPFWSNSSSYNENEVVQSQGKAYKCVMDINCGEDGCDESQGLTNAEYWCISDVKEYKTTDEYGVGELVLYNGFVYKVTKEVLGEISPNGTSNFTGYIGFRHIKTLNKCDTVWNYYEKTNDQNDNQQYNNDYEDCNNVWVDRGDGILIQECYIDNGVIRRFDSNTGRYDWNKLRYDQEYHFYQQYFADHPFVFERLQEKIKYFNPAFHSMTPEGFNARLTFLNQCTRQGNTKTMSDVGGVTANNLAFGRPPFCVLRLGDFYNQMIVIENISIDYSVSDGLQWDLNPEGNGVQPMLCNVNISFKFIGGGDITGPVKRLQNAMTFNYYANTSFYDNRADRVEYGDTNWKTMGGAGNDKIDFGKSYAYQTKKYPDTGV